MQYHAHAYFDPQQLKQVTQLHRELGRLHVQHGRTHARPIGPHPKPMFQVLFAESDLQLMHSWFEANRGSLDVLIHKETGDHLTDHTMDIEWLGDSQNLKLDSFEHQTGSK